MKICLAVDIGGTHTRLELSDMSAQVLFAATLRSARYACFEDALGAFLQQGAISAPIDSACFAVAGPVNGNKATVTNLPWRLNRVHLQTVFRIKRLQLCNDFEAVGHGIADLTAADFVTLQAGIPLASAPRAVIGAGTGLGQAILIPEAKGWRVLPTEGGHVDFAPVTPLQTALLQHLQTRFEHVAYERVLSGPGLVNIYQFLQSRHPEKDNPLPAQADPAAAISQYAQQNPDSLASQALDIFMQIYGAQAGNLALSTLARAGLYIAGGIAVKNLPRMQSGLFMQAFNAKGKMKELAKTIPVKVIQQPEVGLIGARRLAQCNVE